MANEQRRGMGRRMGGRMTVEKPKDFKGSIGKLFAYMKQYHAAVLIVMLCAVASTVFSVIGPDILGKEAYGLPEQEPRQGTNFIR